jgi:DNA-binding NtrC family response regulator
VLCLGVAGQIRYCNSRAAELLGLERAEALGASALPAPLLRLLEKQTRGGPIVLQGRNVLVEAEPLPTGGRVLFLTPREEVGRMARAFSERQSDSAEPVPRRAKPPGPAAPAEPSAAEAIVPLEQLEQQAIRGALRVTGGHVERAAAALGISRASLFRKLKRYGIDRKSP